MVARIQVFFLVLGVASAFLANFENCSDDCEVTELRIEPCKSKAHCLFKRGINVSMEFDFTPNFNAEKLTTAVYLDTSELMIYQQMGIVDACLHTTCPAVAGKSQTFTNLLHIGAKLPKGSYKFRWQLWDSSNNNTMCCFKTVARLA